MLQLAAVSGADYAVISTADMGEGSLREAITYANANPGTRIVFNIPTTDSGFADGVFTIQPTSTLPEISANGAVIDGATQTAFSGDTNTAGPEIVLSGSLAGEGTCGFVIRAANCAVKNLVINGFNRVGIYITDPTAAGNLIQGNYIGTDASGTGAIPNGRHGMEIGNRASNNTIGGMSASDKNIISGNVSAGIYLANARTSGNVMLGNFIGTNATGTTRVANQSNGIALYSGASGNTIGGASASARNIISGNSHHGISIEEASTTENVVQGNYVGTDVSGAFAIRNGGYGIWMAGACSNTIGGTAPGAESDPSGHGEGERYLQSQNVTTNGSGNAGFAVELTGLQAGEIVTATATDQSGNTSEFSGVGDTPIAVGDAKSLGEGSQLATTGIVTYIVSTSGLYIEAEDRSSGIMVYQANHGQALGSEVAVVGSTSTSATLEKYIIAGNIVPLGAGSVDPIMLPTRAVGGGDWRYDPLTKTGQKGIKDAAGLNNIGLLVTVIGEVTFKDSTFFYVDDGSGAQDNSVYRGVKVLGTIPAGADPVGKHVKVTDISSCFKAASPGTDLYRQIRAKEVVLLD